jgi:DNA end-binding protein Ku
MLELASKLIEQKVTHFEPKNYEDRYEAALLEMIKQKLKGQKPVIAQAPERGNVINLMDALKASLGQSKPPAPSKSKAQSEPEQKIAPATKAKPAAKAKAVAAPAAKAAPRRKSA